MIRKAFILVIALILCAIVWWIGPLVAIGVYYPMAGFWVRVIIITLILFWAFWPFFATFIAWIFRHARAPLPKRKKTEQRDRVTSRFYDALKTLQYVGLSKKKTGWQRFRYRFNRQYIQEKPWLLVMGPTGSGKTTLIGESGERFLQAEHYGFQKTVDLESTQDCNLWLAENAVYVDTSGEWMQINGISETSATARDRLFKLIKRYRHQPKVDGIVLCINAQWLMKASVTERKVTADALRVRLMEIASLFRSDMAVYFTLSHLDQLTGGYTFLSMLNDDLLRKGLGFSLNQAKQGETIFEQYESLYNEMECRVSHHVLELLHDAPNKEICRQLLLFTESIGALGKPLWALLEQVFPTTHVGYAGHLRQVWLGSAAILQQSEHDSYEFSADGSRAAGLLYHPALLNAQKERGIMINSTPRSFSQKLGSFIRYSIVFALLGASFNLLTTRYLWESDYISYITARFDETKRMVREIPVTNQISDELLSAYEQMGYMNAQLGDDMLPIINPYMEHKLINDVAKKTYQRHLLQIFWPAVENYVTSELRDDVTKSNQDVYGTLKVYVMLAKPEYRSSDALVEWFMSRWDSLVPQGYSEMNKDIFALHLHEMFSAPNAPVMKVNQDLLRLARVKAMNIPMQVRVVRRIENKPIPAGIKNISLLDAAGPNVSFMLQRKSQSTVTDVAVPAFYTRASYRDVFLFHLNDTAAELIEEESWVIRDKQDESKTDIQFIAQKLSDEARKYYLIEYADKWDFFIHDVGARPVNGLEDAAILAQQLSDPSSPLANLVRFVTRETTLGENSQSGAANWFDLRRRQLDKQRSDIVGEISGERNHFRLTPERAVEDRFQLLRRLGYQLSETNNANNDPLSRVFDGIYNQLTTLSTSLRGGQVISEKDPMRRARLDAARQPEPVRSVILDLLTTGNQQITKQSYVNMTNEVTSLSSGICTNNVIGRYPFSRNARAEVGIEDFSRMFGPNGAMKQFFDTNLSAYVNTNSQTWLVKSGAENIINNKTLKSFEKSALIRDTFFANGDKVSFSMFIRPLSLTPNITEATLDIDGQVINYSHGFSEPVRVEWPGPKGGSYVRLTFRTGTGQIQTVSFDGPWALFRLYDVSNPAALDSDRRELTMSMSSVVGVFKLELRSTMKDFPLWSRGLQGFSCP